MDSAEPTGMPPAQPRGSRIRQDRRRRSNVQLRAVPPRGEVDPTNLKHPALYINRELSWLEFNERVLTQARDATHPLLERVKFLAISAANLDEFFMIRVATTLKKLREGIEELTGEELADEEYDDVPDAVLLWFREDDGDLTDALVDATSTVDPGAPIWLMTPKTGRDGHVEPSEIGEAAQTAGLAQTSSVNAAKDWTGSRLVTPKAARAGKR